MAESNRGRKKINRNKITLDFKCAKCDYAMRESHNILKLQRLARFDILIEWGNLVNLHMEECITPDNNTESILGDILPMDLAIPISAIQEG